MTCPICDSENGCKFTSGYMIDEPLTADDWRRIYYFVRFVQLPFLHSIAARARARAEEKLQEALPPLKPSEVQRILAEPRQMKRIKCDVCGDEIASNWIVRHLKSKHGDQAGAS